VKLHNRKSHVTRLPEGEAPASRGSWVTKWFYYLLLLAITGYAGWHLLDYILYLEVRGQIEVEKTRLAAPRGGIVERIAVLEDQRVAAGRIKDHASKWNHQNVTGIGCGMTHNSN